MGGGLELTAESAALVDFLPPFLTSGLVVLSPRHVGAWRAIAWSPVERPLYGLSAAACAKKGASGRMQRPPELVLIPWCGVKASEGSGKLLHFGKMPKQFGKQLAKIH